MSFINANSMDLINCSDNTKTELQRQAGKQTLLSLHGRLFKINLNQLNWHILCLVMLLNSQVCMSRILRLMHPNFLPKLL